MKFYVFAKRKNNIKPKFRRILQKSTNIPNGKQLPFAPKISHRQMPTTNTQNITAIQPNYRQEKEKISNTKATSTQH